MIFGSNDLTKDIKGRQIADREPLIYSMSRVIIAARATDKAVIDGVHLNVADSEGLRQTCIQGRNLGFDGKSLIHPSQIDIANEVFSPSEEDILHARKVIAAYEAAQQEGRAVCVVDGKLVEGLHVEQAAEILSIADVIAGRSP